jgi:anti-sigma regulatory factor (Ser/Thr protein kinase)
MTVSNIARFPADAEHVADARDFVASYFTGPSRDDARLLTSELAANAIRHGDQAGDTYSVTVECRDDATIRVVVHNTGRGDVPAPKPYRAAEAEDGRGLALVALIAIHWGYGQDNCETAVWFELPGAPTTGLAVAC